MKILIVDDNRQVRELLRSLLIKDHYEFDDREDGDEVVKACEKFKPDLILMDIKMKRKDGITALKEVKIKFPGIAVIMLTNYPHEDLKEESLRAGALRFIDKADLFQLPQIVEEVKNLNRGKS